jgi:tripartite-type tricarboxylate transporter receptor subunit TctC
MGNASAPTASRSGPASDAGTLWVGQRLTRNASDLAKPLLEVKYAFGAKAKPKGRPMWKSRRDFLKLLGSAVAPLALPAVAVAQSYPDRPIRLIVPFPPGGAYDSLGRPWAERIKPLLGSIVVENIGGAGASLGASAVAKARPDGYTILLGGTLPHVNEALLKAKPLYDPNKDLDPIMQIAVGYVCFAVHPSVPARSLAELVAYVKANPAKVSYGHVGIGSTNHLVGELFKSVAGIPELVQVPYRGAGPVIADLIGGQIPMGVVGVTGQSLGFHKSGGLRILAVTSTKPLLAAPELPTVVQAGFPGIANESAYGLLAPAGTPMPIVDKIASTSRALLSTPEYQGLMIEAGFEATPDSDPESFRKVLAAAVRFWEPLVTQLGLKID